MNNVQKIIELIKDSKKIALLYHVNADGDAIGSALALRLAFSCFGGKIDIFAEEEITNSYKFLPSSECITVENEPKQDYDLVIVMDCGDLKRVGKRVEIYNLAPKKINIDHHIHNVIESDARYVVENAAATGELVFKLIRHAGIEITKDIATCLFTAISTDCGSFKFGNTSSETHRIAAELMDCGANSKEIADTVYNNTPFATQKLLGEVLTLMELQFDGKVAFLEANCEMLRKYAVRVEELDNMANYGLSVENVELALFFKEAEPNHIKLSARSKSSFSCSDFTRALGGGGHARAAGCVLEVPMEEAKRIVAEKIKEIGI